MQILSVNVGERQTQPKGHELEVTGIYKMACPDLVRVGRLGLEGDFIGDHKNHGGPDQAVYLYGAPDYAWWAEQLGWEPAPGTFGENLTLSDFESAEYHIGDRLRIGSVILEFTAPRLPCSTLARRMKDPMFVKKYARADRPGMYCRVIQEGALQPGDQAVLEPYGGKAVSSIEIFREHYRHEKDAEALRRFLTAPIAIRMRADVEEDLRKLAGR